MSCRRNEQHTGSALASAKRAMSAQAASVQPLPPTSMIGRSAAASRRRNSARSAAPGCARTARYGPTTAAAAWSRSMSSGKRHDDRAGAAGGRDLERLVQQFRDPLGQVDLRHPFGERRVHLAEIDLLEGFAVDLVARHLPHQHDHRRRILVRRVHPDRGVAGAGAARHQQYAGLAGQFAVGLGHKGGAALLAAGHQADLGGVEEGVEHFEIALAGDAERHLDTVRPQRRDHQLAAAQLRKVGVCRHRRTAPVKTEAAI